MPLSLLCRQDILRAKRELSNPVQNEVELLFPGGRSIGVWVVLDTLHRIGFNSKQWTEYLRTMSSIMSLKH